MSRASGDVQLGPRDALHAFDDTNRHPLVFEDRALLDVQLDVGVWCCCRGAWERADVADPDKLVAEAGTVVHGGAVERLLERHPADVDEAAEHVRCEASAFLVGEEGDAHRPARRDAQRLQGLDGLEPSEHAQVAVETAARGDRVDVRPGHHCRGHGIRARSGGNDVADRVDGDGESEITHPSGHQVAPLPIGVGEGEAGTAELAVRAGDRADLAEGDDAVPQPLAVDACVLPVIHQRQVGHPRTLDVRTSCSDSHFQSVEQLGAAVRVHWTALVIAALLGFALVVDLGAVIGTIGVLSFFLAILLHEIAHAVVARRFGIRTETIELWGLGGMARLDRDPSTPRAEGFIAAAGPLSNAVAGGLAVAAAIGLDALAAPRFLVASMAWFAAVNLALAAFNVLPGAPLDGGRIVRAVRWSQHGSRYRAMREAAYLGSILGWGLVTLGVSFAVTGRSGVWMIVSGLFVAMSARVDVLTATIGERIGAAKVNEFTWFGIAEVGPDMDVDSMIWQRSRLGGAGAVAVRGERARSTASSSRTNCGPCRRSTGRGRC